MSNMNLHVENAKSNQFLHPLCNGDEFPCAWSQSVVLILDQLEKMGNFLFAVPVGMNLNMFISSFSLWPAFCSYGSEKSGLLLKGSVGP